GEGWLESNCCNSFSDCPYVFAALTKFSASLLATSPPRDYLRARRRRVDLGGAATDPLGDRLWTGHPAGGRQARSNGQRKPPHHCGARRSRLRSPARLLRLL